MRKPITTLTRLLALSLLAVVLSHGAFGQQNTQKFKQKAMDAIDWNMASGEYDYALEQLKALNDIFPEDVDVRYKMGLCYFNNHSKRMKALPHFRFVKSSDNLRTDHEIDLYLARVFHLTESFDSAVHYYQSYKTQLDPRLPGNEDLIKELDFLVAQCVKAKHKLSTHELVNITNAGSNINSEFPDYAPVISPDGQKLLFASRRNAFIGVDSAYMTDIAYEHIFESELQADGTWGRPRNLTLEWDWGYHEAPLSISPDGQKLLVYRGNDQTGGDIYICELNEDGNWGAPKKFKDLCTRYHEPSAAFSPDGTKIYFSSTRPEGGFGGLDLWVADLNEKGKITDMRNLGGLVNGPKDEDSPYVLPNGKTLFFTSNGHNTMGGYDIFETNLQNGVWVEPHNLGYPINSAGDDAHLYWNKNLDKAYFSSYRPGTVGGKDIFVLDRGRTEVKLMAYLKDYKDQGNPNKPVDAIIAIVDNETGDTVGVYKTDSEDGSVYATLPYGKEFTAYVTAQGAQNATDTFLIQEPDSFDVAYAAVYEKPLFMEKGDEPKPQTATMLASNTQTSHQNNPDRPNSYDSNEQPNSNNYSQNNSTEMAYQATAADNTSGHTNSYSNQPRSNNSIPEQDNLAYDSEHSKKANKEASYSSDFEGKTTYTANGSVRLKSNQAAQPRSIKPERKLYVNKSYQHKEYLYPKVHFLFDNYDYLTDYSKEWLDVVVAILNKHPDLKIRVIGHADLVGNYGYNEELSRKRSLTVASYLVEHGIDPQRLIKKHYGEKKPIIQTLGRCQANRRVEFEAVTEQVTAYNGR